MPRLKPITKALFVTSKETKGSSRRKAIASNLRQARKKDRRTTNYRYAVNGAKGYGG